MTATKEDARLTVDYCRVSRDKAKTAKGVGSQHGENADYADDELGLTIAETYTDNDVSAYSGTERPNYMRLLDDIAADRIGTVIIWHANRLHRSTDEVGAFIALARKHGVRLFSTSKGGEYRLDRASGKRDLIVDTADAEQESGHKGERVALARRRQSRNGEYGGGSRRAFGWGEVTDRVRSVCVNPGDEPADRKYEDRPVIDMTKHNPAEVAEIRKWASDLLSGIPANAILRDLNTRGVPTITGSPWNSRTLGQILTNPKTSGHSVYKGEIVKRNAYPEILPEDIRQALITLFADPSRKTSPGNVPKWFGSMIYRCGACDDDTIMTVRKNSRGQFTYRCRTVGHCSRVAIPVDAYVERVIIARLSRADIADLLPRAADVDVTALRDELVVLDSRKQDAAQRFALGSIDGPMMDTIVSMVDKRMSAVRAELSIASAESPLTPFVATGKAAGDVWAGLPLAHRRELLRTLATVTLMPSPGKAPIDETIRWEWNS